MPTFANTRNPTPFGFFDSDTGFQTEADAMVTFVELTKKQIWACFEETFLEYGALINTYQAQSQLMSLMGFPTGSVLSGTVNIGPNGYEQLLPRNNFEFVQRAAEPYASDVGMGGMYDTASGSITLTSSVQDYDIYDMLKDGSGDLLFSSSDNSPTTKMRILEVFHFSPSAAYRFFDTTSAINYLNNEFSFESFTPETVFYILPVFEDVLRAGQMDLSNRVRRSNYSYKITGRKIRIFPRPSGIPVTGRKLWLRVGFNPNPFKPDIQDDTIYGVNNISNVPFGNLTFSKVNSIGRQWMRQYALAGSKELLGLVRSKFGSVPMSDGDLTLNGAELVSQGKEEKNDLRTELREMLDKLTTVSLLQKEAEGTEAIRNILKAIPIPNGKAIIMG
jgi:hypothetical protein